jgi:hypothetical protein
MLTFAKFTQGSDLPIRLANHDAIYELRHCESNIKSFVASIRETEAERLMVAKDKVLRYLSNEGGYPDVYYGETIPAIYLNEWFLAFYVPNIFFDAVNLVLIVKVLSGQGAGYVCVEAGRIDVSYEDMRRSPLHGKLASFLSQMNTGLLIDKS